MVVSLQCSDWLLFIALLLSVASRIVASPGLWPTFPSPASECSTDPSCAPISFDGRDCTRTHTHANTHARKHARTSTQRQPGRQTWYQPQTLKNQAPTSASFGVGGCVCAREGFVGYTSIDDHVLSRRLVSLGCACWHSACRTPTHDSWQLLQSNTTHASKARNQQPTTQAAH